jgi:pimeloyl-ACP methyl ester carboxylesterase
LGPWGTLDTAGNLREWVWNWAGDRALALGGAWSDYAATYQAAFTADPMDRSPQQGMRLMQLLDQASMRDELLAPIELTYDADAAPRHPVDDAGYAAMRFRFSAPTRRPESVKTEELDRTDLWIAEELELGFAPQEGFSLVLVRPLHHNRPLQPIIFAPPGDAFALPRPNRAALTQLRNASYVVQSGRALVIPIWAGSFERFEPRPVTPAQWQARMQQRPLEWYRDLVTTLDYLESRDDMDSTRVGMLAISYGSQYLAPILLALESRLKSAVVVSGGVTLTIQLDPVFDAVNWLPRVTQPVLLINGRFDHMFPYEQSQKRYLDLLGSPQGAKAQKVYDVGHFAFPGHVLPRDASDWFDRTLGPVH